MYARVHAIETASGTLETPAIFPVHNLSLRGNGTTPDYWNAIPDMNKLLLNAHAVKTNANYRKILAQGLHSYFNIKGVIFIDSGGFQCRTRNSNLDPLEVLHIQENIGADIASTLDYPILCQDNIAQPHHGDFIRDTVKNALTCLEHREREDMRLFAVVHGNDERTILNMVDYLQRRGNFDGFAIGGLVFKKSDQRTVIDIIISVRKRIKDKPLHVFGLGGPSFIPLLTYIGVDTFDSSAFLKGGSKRVYFLPDRGSREFKEMVETEFLPCICPICSKYSFNEIRSNRRLIGLHNLWVLAYELRKLKIHILEDDLESYLEYRFMNNLQIKDTFRYAKSKVRGFR